MYYGCGPHPFGGSSNPLIRRSTRTYVLRKQSTSVEQVEHGYPASLIIRLACVSRLAPDRAKRLRHMYSNTRFRCRRDERLRARQTCIGYTTWDTLRSNSKYSSWLPTCLSSRIASCQCAETLVLKRRKLFTCIASTRKYRAENNLSNESNESNLITVFLRCVGLLCGSISSQLSFDGTCSSRYSERIRIIGYHSHEGPASMLRFLLSCRSKFSRELPRSLDRMENRRWLHASPCTS